MLNRTSISTPDSRVTWGVTAKGLLAGPSAWLIQLAVIAVVICLLTCVYLWQSSTISQIERDTQQTTQKIDELEHTNVALMLQLAALNQPAYIEHAAREQGLAPGKTPLVMQVPVAATAASASASAPAEAPLWQRLVSRLSQPPMLIHFQTWIR